MNGTGNPYRRRSRGPIAIDGIGTDDAAAFLDSLVNIVQQRRESYSSSQQQNPEPPKSHSKRHAPATAAATTAREEDKTGYQAVLMIAPAADDANKGFTNTPGSYLRCISFEDDALSVAEWLRDACLGTPHWLIRLARRHPDFEERDGVMILDFGCGLQVLLILGADTEVPETLDGHVPRIGVGLCYVPAGQDCDEDGNTLQENLLEDLGFLAGSEPILPHAQCIERELRSEKEHMVLYIVATLQNLYPFNPDLKYDTEAIRLVVGDKDWNRPIQINILGNLGGNKRKRDYDDDGSFEEEEGVVMSSDEEMMEHAQPPRKRQKTEKKAASSATKPTEETKRPSAAGKKLAPKLAKAKEDKDESKDQAATTRAADEKPPPPPKEAPSKKKAAKPFKEAPSSKKKPSQTTQAAAKKKPALTSQNASKPPPKEITAQEEPDKPATKLKPSKKPAATARKLSKDFLEPEEGSNNKKPPSKVAGKQQQQEEGSNSEESGTGKMETTKDIEPISDPKKWPDLSKNNLKDQLVVRGLGHWGTKAQMLDRLQRHVDEDDKKGGTKDTKAGKAKDDGDHEQHQTLTSAKTPKAVEPKKDNRKEQATKQQKMSGTSSKKTNDKKKESEATKPPRKDSTASAKSDISTAKLITDPIKFHHLTIADLKTQCSLRDLPRSGKKPDLIERLERHIKEKNDEKVDNIKDNNENNEVEKTKKRKASDADKTTGSKAPPAKKAKTSRSTSANEDAEKSNTTTPPKKKDSKKASAKKASSDSEDDNENEKVKQKKKSKTPSKKPTEKSDEESSEKKASAKKTPKKSTPAKKSSKDAGEKKERKSGRTFDKAEAEKILAAGEEEWEKLSKTELRSVLKALGRRLGVKREDSINLLRDPDYILPLRYDPRHHGTREEFDKHCHELEEARKEKKQKESKAGGKKEKKKKGDRSSPSKQKKDKDSLSSQLE